MFEKEIETFEKQRMFLWEKFPGEYVAIKEEWIIGPYESAEQAFNHAVRYFGHDSGFMMKQIFDKDPIYFMGGWKLNSPIGDDFPYNSYQGKLN